MNILKEYVKDVRSKKIWNLTEVLLLVLSLPIVLFLAVVKFIITFGNKIIVVGRSK